MKVYLYKCDDCGNAKFTEGDEGNVRYYHCVGCKVPTFHHRVVIVKSKYLLPSIQDEYEFKVLRGKGEDDSEEKINEH